MPQKKVVVVTGGAGFLGSHLCDRFLKEDCKVICIDNLITGNLNNIKHLKTEKNFSVIKHDVSKPIKIPGKIDYIMQFASPASPVDYLNHPIVTMEVGSKGTHNMLLLAKSKKARIMIASTSEVYGDPLEHPQKESYWGNVNPIGPRGVYDEAKRFAEAITMAYHRYDKVDTRIVRIFNTYGPRMNINDGRLVPNFVYQVMHDKPLTVYGKGTQTRSFCYYSDLIEGILRLLKSSIHTPINVGNPGEFSILEFTTVFEKIVGKKLKIDFKELPTDDPKVRRPDITLAKQYLKWEPKVTLEEGLKETYHWFLQNYKKSKTKS